MSGFKISDSGNFQTSEERQAQTAWTNWAVAVGVVLFILAIIAGFCFCFFCEKFQKRRQKRKERKYHASTVTRTTNLAIAPAPLAVGNSENPLSTSRSFQINVTDPGDKNSIQQVSPNEMPQPVYHNLACSKSDPTVDRLDVRRNTEEYVMNELPGKSMSDKEIDKVHKKKDYENPTVVLNDESDYIKV